jgi:hypothetical protein
MFVVIELWMIGLQWLPHFNQDTQASKESYMGHWIVGFPLKETDLEGIALIG